MLRGLLPATFLVLAAGACARDAGETADAAIATEPATIAGAPSVSHDASLGVGLAFSEPPGEEVAARRLAVRQATAASRSLAQNPLIIRSGSVSVRVDSVERAIEAVQRIVASLGGQMAGVNLTTGDNQVRSATLEVRVPAARFDEAMSAVRPLGKVEHSVTHAVDVGEEYVDVAARVANAKRLEQRLLTLLATRTGKLEDVLAVERELARVREEIERHEGRIRYLDSRIAMSALTVSVHEKAPLVASQPGTNPLRVAFVNMWRNFVLFLAAGIEALGVIVPVALLLAAGALGWKKWRKQRLAVG